MIAGHIAPQWDGYEAASAHEEKIYEVQDLIMAAELSEDALALAGLKRCYVHLVTWGKQH